MKIPKLADIDVKVLDTTMKENEARGNLLLTKKGVPSTDILATPVAHCCSLTQCCWCRDSHTRIHKPGIHNNACNSKCSSEASSVKGGVTEEKKVILIGQCSHADR